MPIGACSQTHDQRLSCHTMQAQARVHWVRLGGSACESKLHMGDPTTDSIILSHVLAGTYIMVLAAGLKLAPGTYHVSAKVEDGFHIYFLCGKDHTQPFEIDFSGVFLYFTVSLRSCPAVSARSRAQEWTLS